jgi:hypothetical protein
VESATDKANVSRPFSNGSTPQRDINLKGCGCSSQTLLGTIGLSAAATQWNEDELFSAAQAATAALMALQ